MLDGFGEVQQPQQFGNPFEYQSTREADRIFGPWPTEDYYNHEDNRFSRACLHKTYKFLDCYKI